MRRLSPSTVLARLAKGFSTVVYLNISWTQKVERPKRLEVLRRFFPETQDRDLLPLTFDGEHYIAVSDEAEAVRFRERIRKTSVVESMLAVSFDGAVIY